MYAKPTIKIDIGSICLVYEYELVRTGSRARKFRRQIRDKFSIYNNIIDFPIEYCLISMFLVCSEIAVFLTILLLEIRAKTATESPDKKVLIF